MDDKELAELLREAANALRNHGAYTFEHLDRIQERLEEAAEDLDSRPKSG